MNNFTVQSEEEIAEFISTHPDWRYEDDLLKADFVLSSFAATMKVIARVGEEAERMNHHPEWSNAYTKLSFAFATHDADNKITNLDTEMAMFISIAVAEQSA